MVTKQSPNFRRFLKGAAGGEVAIPILRAILYDPKFKSFNIVMPDMGGRKPDNWFHPSTHPLWPERLLYYYLANADRIVPEMLDPTSTMAINQGHFWHSLIQRCLMDANYLIGQEVPVADEQTGSRGHMDGLTKDHEVFEFKTMNRTKLSKIEKGAPDDPAVLASFKEMKPEYFAQGQEYMRLSGYRRWRGVILALEYPFEMREVVMDYDHIFCEQLRQKYLRVRQAVADQRPPLECCGTPGSKVVKSCPARLLCPTAAL